MRYLTTSLGAIVLSLAALSPAAAGNGGNPSIDAPYGKIINGPAGPQVNELIDVSATPVDVNPDLTALMQSFKQPAPSHR